MCGRFNIIDDPLTQLIVEITGQDIGWRLETEYNIAPTQTIPVLLEEEGTWTLKPMRWWLVPHWAKEPDTRYSMFNAKSETVSQSRAFKQPFERRRCIIPVSGYYEWHKQAGQKLPYYMTPDHQPGFAFAGLWDRWRGDDQMIESCTIVTAAAPTEMAHIHHRIPVQLTTDESRLWTSQETSLATLGELMRPEIKTTIRVTPVSTIVNNARNKEPRCIEPLGDSTLITPESNGEGVIH